MGRISGLLTALGVLLLPTGCLTTEVQGHWKEPNFEGEPFDRMMVLGVAADPEVRRTFESIFADELRKRGVDALPSYLSLELDDLERQQIVDAARSNEVDGILVVRQIGVEREEVFVPGTAYQVPHGYYSRFGPYYSRSYSVSQTAGYMREETRVRLETNLYGTADEALIWSAISETIQPRSLVAGHRGLQQVDGQDSHRDRPHPRPLRISCGGSRAAWPSLPSA